MDSVNKMLMPTRASIASPLDRMVRLTYVANTTGSMDGEAGVLLAAKSLRLHTARLPSIPAIRQTDATMQATRLGKPLLDWCALG